MEKNFVTSIRCPTETQTDEVKVTSEKVLVSDLVKEVDPILPEEPQLR